MNNDSLQEYAFEDFLNLVGYSKAESKISKLLDESTDKLEASLNYADDKTALKDAKKMQAKRDYKGNVKKLNNLDIHQSYNPNMYSTMKEFKADAFQKKLLAEKNSPDWIIIPGYQFHQSLLFEVPDQLINKVAPHGFTTTEGPDGVVYHLPIEVFLALCNIQQKLNKVKLQIYVDKSTISRPSRELEVQVINPNNPLVK